MFIRADDYLDLTTIGTVIERKKNREHFAFNSVKMLPDQFEKVFSLTMELKCRLCAC